MLGGPQLNYEVTMTPFDVPVTLTERQQSILTWLLRCWLDLETSPTIHEMRVGFGLKSTNSIALDLAVLRGAGLVAPSERGSARSLRLTRQGACLAAWYTGHSIVCAMVEETRGVLDDIERTSARAAKWREDGERMFSEESP